MQIFKNVRPRQSVLALLGRRYVGTRRGYGGIRAGRRCRMRFLYAFFSLLIFLVLLYNSIYFGSASAEAQLISIAIVIAGALAGGDGK